MSSWDPPSGPPWYGVDDGLLRRLEIHETEVHGLGPGRRVIDLGDALGLFDAVDPDPFYNRVGAIRWPDDREAFDARVDAVVALFRSERRQPYLWLAPGSHRPADLTDRLMARGFIEIGDGALVLILVRDPRADPVGTPGAGTVIERLSPEVRDGGISGARAAAAIVAEAFGVAADRIASLEAEILGSLTDPAVDTRLASVEGVPVAVGRRHDRGELGYLSAIGVRQAWQGRGLGEAITRTLVDAALDDGRRWVYLGVYPDNVRARATYERVGFATLGERALELILL